MKKIVIFIHGEIYPEFTEKNSLHKEFNKAYQGETVWKLISGHLNKNDEDFSQVLEELKNADIFLCDSSNTNLEGEVENLNFDSICHQNLKNALRCIKKKNPQLKIFIKNFCYSQEKEIKSLSKYGEIIDYWQEEKVVSELQE